MPIIPNQVESLLYLSAIALCSCIAFWDFESNICCSNSEWEKSLLLFWNWISTSLPTRQTTPQRTPTPHLLSPPHCNDTLGGTQHLCEVAMEAAQRIVRMDLPVLDTVYANMLVKNANIIVKDNTHLSYALASSKQYRTIKTRVNRLKNWFYPREVASIIALL